MERKIDVLSDEKMQREFDKYVEKNPSRKKDLIRKRFFVHRTAGEGGGELCENGTCKTAKIFPPGDFETYEDQLFDIFSSSYGDEKE
ncbi:hypothetical protein [Mesotoga sp. BH458_6_3_2_1]|uniref:hypothetical protein n=1 Tax=Mesotoga sp. BH458_6_3_2_1 TaxID=1437446 RepID=UPI000EF22318|nr:hypothetical protein [Mesotoga sp. BH458_6_3_2_1]RLL86715.1 hypothetical protein Y697_08300 [Mesotoga sp. BH458_6_3_2_1]